MTDYRELHRLEQRLKQVRTYLESISPKLTRYKELKQEEKEILRKLNELSV